MIISRPAQTAGLRSLIVGLILALITAYLLIVVGKNETLSGIDQVLLIIAGMTTIATLSALGSFIEESKKTDSSVDNISFSEALVSTRILEGKTDASTIVTIERKDQVSSHSYSPWELNLNQLVGIDNSLALAQLRIEIEIELRRIAYKHGIDITVRPIGVVAMAQELVYKEVIPAVWLGVLKEINTVCNKAIHGLEISDEQSISVVRVGGQMLEQLRLVASEKQ